MYTVSQWAALGVSLAVCAAAVLYADLLAALLPTQSVSLSVAEQSQLLSSLVFHTAQSHREQQALAQTHANGGSPAITTTGGGGGVAPRRPRVAFCCSADLDVSVRAVALMAHVESQSEATQDLVRQHHERIGDLHALQESFAFYFANGAAAEQSMSSREQFHEVVQWANAIDGVSHNVGGNAAVMADRAAIEGCDVLLGAAIGREMRKHFNTDIQLVGHLDDEEHEDVHLVLEYAKGDTFRGHASPRANRYYLNHDIYNARLSVLEEFEVALDDFAPDLVVLGGLQLMEVETDETRRLERLTKLSDVLQNLFLKKIPSHYEFAAVSDFTLFDDTVRLVLPWVDSIGLNEQELYILHHFLVTGEQGTATTSRPTVAQISRQLHEVIQLAAKARHAFQHSAQHQRETQADETDKSASSRELALAQMSRIHFHTLQFHIICQRQDGIWEDPTTALIQSALMSTKVACGKKRAEDEGVDATTMRHSSEMELDPERVELLLTRQVLVSEAQSLNVEIDPFAPVTSWQEADFTCHMVPMLACKKPDHTAGLGDNISGTGIAYHRLQRMASPFP